MPMSEKPIREGELSPHDVGFKLNNIRFSSLKYAKPKEALTKLFSGTESSSNEIAS